MTATAIGIDLGSRATKILWLCDGRTVRTERFDTAHDAISPLRDLLGDTTMVPVVATGYGRNLANSALSCTTVSEILACARGARHLDPHASSVIDIGGQDSKVIQLTEEGKPARFEMNDRCAAGTGRFLEVMAKALGYELGDFGHQALEAESPIRINSMCTVFAESEVVARIAQGEDPQRIALGLHVAVARRTAALASRVRLGPRTLFVGGVANNLAMVNTLAGELDTELIVPEQPEFVVALGAALTALQTHHPRSQKW